jgi:hypothetical protein|tara:strand:- start:6047 stop:6295 length:249 start_codon:yes stop_codon:yes gene_type:complete
MSYPEGYTTSMINSFAHCSLCLNELPKHLTPQEYSWIECGINYDKKFQINCIRHDKVLLIFEIKNIPFEQTCGHEREEEEYE